MDVNHFREWPRDAVSNVINLLRTAETRQAKTGAKGFADAQRERSHPAKPYRATVFRSIHTSRFIEPPAILAGDHLTQATRAIPTVAEDRQDRHCHLTPLDRRQETC